VNAQSIIVSISSGVLMQYVDVSLLINGTEKRECMKNIFLTNITKVFTSAFSAVLQIRGVYPGSRHQAL
jgi:hypothetical protein